MTIQEMLSEIRDAPNVQMSAYLWVHELVRKRQIGKKEVREVLLGVRELDAELPVEMRRSVSCAEVISWGAIPR